MSLAKICFEIREKLRCRIGRSFQRAFLAEQLAPLYLHPLICNLPYTAILKQLNKQVEGEVSKSSAWTAHCQIGNNSKCIKWWNFRTMKRHDTQHSKRRATYSDKNDYLRVKQINNKSLNEHEGWFKVAIYLLNYNWTYIGSGDKPCGFDKDQDDERKCLAKAVYRDNKLYDENLQQRRIARILQRDEYGVVSICSHECNTISDVGATKNLFWY